MAKKELTITEFRAIIREEAIKLKKRIVLENEKKALKEELKNILNESCMEECGQDGYETTELEEVISEGQKDIEKALKINVQNWVRQGAIKQPSPEEIENIRKQAAENNWEGKISIAGGQKKQVKDRSGRIRNIITGGVLSYNPMTNKTKVQGFGHGAPGGNFSNN